MFTVKKTPKTPNIVWDVATNKPLCRFEGGELEISDEALAQKLAEMGYEVYGEADKAEQHEEKIPADIVPAADETEEPKNTTGERKKAAK